MTIIISGSSIVIFNLPMFLVRLLFVHFISLHILICYYFSFLLWFNVMISLILLLPLLFLFILISFFLLFSLFLFSYSFLNFVLFFSFYFSLSNSLSYMKRLRLVDSFVCLFVYLLFCFLNWNCRVIIYNLITFLQFPKDYNFLHLFLF